jgi:hypothetical protein
MSITPKESELIRKINAITSAPNITPAQQAQWSTLVDQHEALCRSLVSGSGTERRQ